MIRGLVDFDIVFCACKRIDAGEMTLELNKVVVFIFRCDRFG